MHFPPGRGESRCYIGSFAEKMGAMVEDTDILGTVISWLEKEKRQGRKRIRLTPEAKRALAASSAGAAQSVSPAVPVSRPAPVSVPLARPLTPPHAGEGTGAPRGAVPASAFGNSAAPPADLPPLDLSAHTLATLPALVAACTRCGLHAQGRKQTVFADGSPQARLMFIGEGPGAEEDEQGVPFIGAAGQLLTKMIAAMKLPREAVYVTNIVKCRPPGSRAPTDDEGRACLPYVQRQIELVKPEVIVVLGGVPFLHLLGQKGITSGRGRWYEYCGRPVMATYHPAFLLRMPGKKGEAWNDLQLVMARLGLK